MESRLLIEITTIIWFEVHEASWGPLTSLSLTVAHPVCISCFLDRDFNGMAPFFILKRAFWKKNNISFITLAIWPEGSWFLMKEQIFTTLLWMSWALLCQHCSRRRGRRPLLTLAGWPWVNHLTSYLFRIPVPPRQKEMLMSFLVWTQVAEPDDFLMYLADQGFMVLWYGTPPCWKLLSSFCLQSQHSLGIPTPSHNKSWMWVNHNLTT